MGEPDPREATRPVYDPTNPSPPDPELGDYGAAVTFDSSGRVVGVAASVAGQGPFTYPSEQPQAPGQPAAPQATSQQDARLRHDIDLVLQAVQHLDAQQDTAGIAHAVVTVLTMANAAVHHTEWVESEGLAEETRHWTGVTGEEGALESFQAARHDINEAARHLVQVLEPLLATRDVVSRSIQIGTRGGEALRYLAQVCAHVRGRLSFTTPQALHLLDEAIRNLESASGGELIVRDVLGVLSMTNNALLGTQHWEPSLEAEYRAWAPLGQQSGTEAQFQQVRDDVLTAARSVRHDLDHWQHRRVDAGAAARLTHPLAHAAEQARGRLTPP